MQPFFEQPIRHAQPDVRQSYTSTHTCAYLVPHVRATCDRARKRGSAAARARVYAFRGECDSTWSHGREMKSESNQG